MIEFINGDITKKDNIQVIVHQCNCVTIKAAQLAWAIFDAFPWADIYSIREGKNINPRNLEKGNKPGEIIVRGNGKDKRFVINILGQVYPGKSRFVQSSLDGVQTRESYFKEALNKIAKIKNLKSIVFPDHIGCGVAGGSWANYKKMIEEFTEEVEKKGTKVCITTLT